MLLGRTKLPRLALWYHPTLFASTFISRRHRIISAWYHAFAFALGAAAAVLAALLSLLKSPVEAAGSADGKGNELVTWSSPSTSIPIRPYKSQYIEKEEEDREANRGAAR